MVVNECIESPFKSSQFIKRTSFIESFLTYHKLDLQRINNAQQMLSDDGQNALPLETWPLWTQMCRPQMVNPMRFFSWCTFMHTIESFHLLAYYKLITKWFDWFLLKKHPWSHETCRALSCSTFVETPYSTIQHFWRQFGWTFR